MREAITGAVCAIAFIVGLAWGFDRFVRSLERAYRAEA